MLKVVTELLSYIVIEQLFVVNCHTANISKYIEYHLQPVVKQIPSYIKDTNDFINKINDIGNIPPNSYLVTMDVKSLYTNIPNSEGIAAVKNAYDNYLKKSIATKVITTFLAFILTLNNFIFNCKRYLQIKGCGMGTICAAAYANIFMASFESKIIYPFMKEKVITFLRFIDDLFMIWTDAEEELLKFINELNQKYKTIKFYFKY